MQRRVRDLKAKATLNVQVHVQAHLNNACVLSILMLSLYAQKPMETQYLVSKC